MKHYLVKAKPHPKSTTETRGIQHPAASLGSNGLVGVAVEPVTPPVRWRRQGAPHTATSCSWLPVHPLPGARGRGARARRENVYTSGDVMH